MRLDAHAESAVMGEIPGRHRLTVRRVFDRRRIRGPRNLADGWVRPVFFHAFSTLPRRCVASTRAGRERPTKPKERRVGRPDKMIPYQRCLYVYGADIIHVC